jgi:hypothetical protein
MGWFGVPIPYPEKKIRKREFVKRKNNFWGGD